MKEVRRVRRLQSESASVAAGKKSNKRSSAVVNTVERLPAHGKAAPHGARVTAGNQAGARQQGGWPCTGDVLGATA
jgi:hypothetical protein